MPIPASSSFDYSILPEEVAAHASETAKAFRAFRCQAAADTARFGHEFCHLKTQMMHGTFVSYVENACLTSVRMVQYCMTVAQAFGDKCEAISHLRSSTAIALSAKSVPQTIRDDVIEAHAAGTPWSEKDIRRRLAENNAPTAPQLSPVNRTAEITDAEVREGLRHLEKASRSSILSFLETLDTIPAERYRDYLRSKIVPSKIG